MADDAGNAHFLTLIWPQFGKLANGGVEAVTPILVVIIWLVALGVMGFSWWQVRVSKRWVRETRDLVADLSKADVPTQRTQILERAKESSEPVAHAWQEFDETLVAEGGQLYNTVDAAEFFNEHRFASRLVDNRFLHAAPTALTTLGLLGTFLGLTVGLRGLDLGSTSDQLRTGIQTLVYGAALGFTASLWGVFMSLVVNVVGRWQERHVVRRIRELQARVDSLFRLRSPEQSLSDIASHTGESKEALQVLHEKVGSALQEAVAHVGGNTSRAVSNAISNSLAPVMADLAEKAANQSADVFRTISGELTASFNEIGMSLAKELKDSSSSMKATIDYMGEQLARHAEQHMALLDAHREAMAAQLQIVTDATSRQLLLLDESLPKVIAGLDQAAEVVSTATTGMDSAAANLTEVADRLGSTSTTIAGMLVGATEAVEQLASRTADAAGVMTEQQRTVTHLTEKALSAAELLEEASESLSGGLGGMRSAQEAFLADLRRQLHSHSEEMSGWLVAYSDQVSKDTGRRMDEWNVQTREFSTQMLNATSALSDAIDELGDRRPDQPTRVA